MISDASSPRPLDLGESSLHCAWAAIADHTGALAPQEAATLQRANPKRRAEYATARMLAKHLLAGFGIEDFPLLSGAKREPLWPPGVVGSVTHTDTHAAVAVARNAHIRALGIDLETCARVTPKLLPKLLTPSEIERYSDVDPTLIFSAKEACYKFLYPSVRAYVDYLDVEVHLSSETSTFALSYVGEKLENIQLADAEGMYFKHHQQWFCYVVARQR